MAAMEFTDQNQNGAMYMRHIKGAFSPKHTNGGGSALAFENGRLLPPAKLAEYLAGEGHRHVGKDAMEGDVVRTFMPSASPDHSRPVPLSRHEGDHPVSIMLPRRVDGEMPSIYYNYPQAVSLGNDVHPSPSSVDNPGTIEPAVRPAPSALRLACVASPSNSSVRESSFFTSALVSRASPVNSHPSKTEVGDEKRFISAEMDMPNKSLLHGSSPVSNKVVMEVGTINAKLLPAYVTAGAGGAPILTKSNLQRFEASSNSANVGCLPRESTNIPVTMVGVTASSDGPQEHASVQNFPSNHALNKPCGWKRPCQALHESTHQQQNFNRLGLNRFAGGSYKEFGSTGVSKSQQSAVKTHHSGCLMRPTASEDCSVRPLKIRLCETWGETRPSKALVGRDAGFYTDESLSKERTYESKRVSCSSVFPRSSTPGTQLLTGSNRQKSTDDFLSLGLSSYSVSAQHELDEVNSRAAITPEGTKHVHVCSKKCHDILQLQLCINPHQAQVQQIGLRSSVVADEFISGGARLSYRFSSNLSSDSLTGHCHRQTERQREEPLDLRLKLAL